MTFRSFMDAALERGAGGGAAGRGAGGAVVVAPSGEVVARAGNRTRELATHGPRRGAGDPGGLRAPGSERLPGHALG
jgi:cytidine deaminase